VVRRPFGIAKPGPRGRALALAHQARKLLGQTTNKTEIGGRLGLSRNAAARLLGAEW
jgi:hypothetical protein